MTIAFLSYAVYTIRPDSSDRTLFLPGPMSSGHHQIGVACGACHTDPFGGGEVLQNACIDCHGKELKAANDSHPLSKFNDPRNADRLAKLDARQCVSCHTEHRPEIAGIMGVTVAKDFCIHCHADIAEERPSHAGFEFTGCATGGCHNFHDNSALYEDFLTKHLNEPDQLAQPRIASLGDLRSSIMLVARYPIDDYPLRPLSLADRDAPLELRQEPLASEEWLATSHARAGVNCSACHEEPGKEAGWVHKPDHNSCIRCHGAETKGFLAGKHGMTLAQELPPMTPAQAQLPMRPLASHRELSCTSCHSAHRFDTRHAAVDSCLGCHDDGHSRAYRNSPHFNLWFRENNGQGSAGSGVSCATCHLPRVSHEEDGVRRMLVQHNQNDTLRPNEKMLRPVCMQCHGLEFALDALADPALIENNFTGRPAGHVQSLDMAAQRKGPEPEQEVPQ